MVELTRQCRMVRLQSSKKESELPTECPTVSSTADWVSKAWMDLRLWWSTPLLHGYLAIRPAKKRGIWLWYAKFKSTLIPADSSTASNSGEIVDVESTEDQ